MDKYLDNYFNKYSTKYEEYEHKAVFTVEESKELKKEIPGLHCKTLFLKDDKENFYLVGMPAQKRLDVKKLRCFLGARKLHFASAEELWEKLNLKHGSVSIFGILNNKNKDVILIIDKEVWNAEKSGFHPNINTSTLVLKREDLEKFYDSVKNNKKVIDL